MQMDEPKKDSLAWADSCFRYLEACTVIGIVVLAASACGYELFWIVTGGAWRDAHARFADALTQVDAHWKIGLALLIPLFYRTIRQFMEEMEEAPLGFRRKKRGKMSQEEEAKEAGQVQDDAGLPHD